MYAEAEWMKGLQSEPGFMVICLTLARKCSKVRGVLSPRVQGWSTADKAGASTGAVIVCALAARTPGMFGCSRQQALPSPFPRFVVFPSNSRLRQTMPASPGGARTMQVGASTFTHMLLDRLLVQLVADHGKYPTLSIT